MDSSFRVPIGSAKSNSNVYERIKPRSGIPSYDALPEASRAAATVNVYDEESGGALHCREGAITKSQYTVVAPFLAAALGEASTTDAPTSGSDGTDGRSHSVLLGTAVFLLLF